jgi:LPS-assembly protein
LCFSVKRGDQLRPRPRRRWLRFRARLYRGRSCRLLHRRHCGPAHGFVVQPPAAAAAAVIVSMDLSSAVLANHGFCSRIWLQCLPPSCYGARLKVSSAPQLLPACVTLPQILRNIFGRNCHGLYCGAIFLAALCQGFGQVPPAVKPARPNAPARDEIVVRAVTQESEGSVRRLRGAAEIETTEMLLRADEIDYDEEKHYAEARGSVRFDHFEGGEHIEADKVEYDLAKETGRYYNVRGSSPAKLEARPGVLTTTSPFSFQGKWAERIQNRYILHDGFVTNCKLPKPWWVLNGREFEIIPGQKAIARHSVFRLKGVPLLYAPKFYKSLERAPRQSGFLTPNFGNSSRRGLMLGGGYYWAISRSYDAMYRAQWFTQRGVAHHVDFRGKPGQRTDFNFLLYGVNDKGFKNPDGTRRPPEGGFLTNTTARTDLDSGWRARGQFNYLSSFAFRQAFTESFFEAIYSEVNSLGHMSRYWDTFAVNFVASRIESFQWPTAESYPFASSADNKLSLRRLPSVEFNSRDRQIAERVLPVWLSWTSSASFLRRHERSFTTAQFVDRQDFEPRVMTALRWKDIHLIPSFSLRETRYGSSVDAQGRIVGNTVLRSSREFSADLILPSIARVFDKPPAWLGTKLKHVIEPRVTYRKVGGIGQDFHRLIRFDETELLADTSEVDFTITNRFFTKSKAGAVSEVLSWELTHRRYFDPTLGGAVIEGRRNVLASSASLTGYAFFDAPRSYSPLISNLRATLGRTSVEWRADYDPARSRFVNSTLSAYWYKGNYFASVGHNQVRSVPVTTNGETLTGLTPSANQVFAIARIGQENRRGWSAGGMTVYDFARSLMIFGQTQVTYNTDCCGWSVQYRRFGFGSRNENQFLVAFAVANIGSFGTLRRQERMF